MAIREEGDWEGWLAFFLRGVAQTAEEATATARAIIALQESHRTLLQEQGFGINALRLLDVLFEQPLITPSTAKEALRISFTTASKLLDQFESVKLVQETTGGHRHRRYRYAPYLRLFDENQPDVSPDALTPIQATHSE